MTALNIFDSPYFRLNKKLLCIVGLWSYDTRRNIVRKFWIALLFSFNVPHVIAVLCDMSDLDKLMEHLVISLILVAAFLKHFTLVIAEDKMKSVYNDIANNWLMIIDENEKKILVEYSKRGRIITIAYTALLTCAAMVFMLLPLVPEILNVIDPLPIPRAHIYILNGEFLVENRDDHFWKIYLWDAASIVSITIICIAIDPMYSVSVEHGAALFAIVTYRLSKLKHQIENDMPDESDSSYDWFLHTIKLHQTVLRFTRNINDSYSACFFCLTLMNLVDLPVTCVVVMIHWNNPMNLIRYAFVLVGLMQHLFVLFWPGQKLIDHSIRLIDDACCNEWYETTDRTKKLLRIFMTRCSKPCLITAGGLVEMNFEVYFKVVKTAASYITVLASFR